MPPKKLDDPIDKPVKEDKFAKLEEKMDACIDGVREAVKAIGDLRASMVLKKKSGNF